VNRDDLIRIYMKRAILVLDEKELLALLKERPDIWATGLQRGKGILRARQAGRRTKQGRDRSDTATMEIT
jgi:hypothetical protein